MTPDASSSLQPSGQCKRYLSCLLVVAPQSYGAALVLYGDGSECWKTAEQSTNCGIACESAYEDIAAQCTCEGSTCMPASPCADDSAYEPNDTMQTATAGASYPSLAICPASDQDWFRVSLATPKNLEAIVTPTNNAVLPRVSVRNANGGALANGSPTADGAVRVYTPYLPAGTYFIDVSAPAEVSYSLTLTLTN